MVPSGKLGTSLPLRLGTIAEEQPSGTFGFGQAQAKIKAFSNKFAQAQARIVDSEDCNTTSPSGNLVVVTGVAETLLPGCDIWVTASNPIELSWDIWISHQNPGTFKQELLTIKRDDFAGTVLASFSTPSPSDGGDITTGHQFNWAGTLIDASPTTGHYILSVTEIGTGIGDPNNTHVWSDTRTFCASKAGAIYVFGQAQADIRQTYLAYAQAQALIVVTGIKVFGQAQAEIVYKRWGFGQAQAQIYLKRSALGQAQARILQVYSQPAQAQALIVVKNINKFAQAQAEIVYKRWAFGQAQAVIFHGFPGPDPGPQPDNISPPQYIVVFNGQQLYGYAQTETLITEETIDDFGVFRWDGSPSQQATLTNPVLSMDFLIYTVDWRRAKDLLHQAERVMLSSKNERKRLYVDYTDRHYLASFKSLSYQKDVKGPRKTLPYTVQFEIDPQIISDESHELSGAGTLVTTGRTLANGGWTPTLMQISGNNVTVSGYTDTEFTGYISVSGAVSNLVIDSEAFTAKIGDDNAADLLKNVDYAMFVGPGVTTFEVTGATSISITYNDRWY